MMECVRRRMVVGQAAKQEDESVGQKEYRYKRS
jgi:hypothetical protein